ncbi:ABC transporter, ATP-binding protein [Streptomyces venezuelae]|uniref:ABC transporter ATP-binding protein n=1 Tax=Streptomyces gardneri TaxID=66892 RepID=UPI0006BC3E65|nr:ABC transporter ATP-binding protein [Streptomyces gardneri]ALO13048.1 ABC transporter, ATP-binding protein [Streptomyces venezuelae]WRK41282.1 ABC transporter ATP-binding protein [Streptomyces venezuelae]CUM36283.1 ABC transporter [Streptomyces venezuelae]
MTAPQAGEPPSTRELPPALELTGVTKEYPGSPPLRILHGIDLTVDAGELLAVVGPSGSGKSTLLALLGSLDRPTGGRLRFEGRDLSHLADTELAAVRAHRIGFVFQQFFLLSGLSTVENVATGLLYSGVPAARRREAAVEALREVGLGHRLGHRPDQLSGGEKQRVAIARALVGRPALLLADEPTGALDSSSGAAVVDLLRALNDSGTTVVVITHDRDLAASFPRRVGIHDGRVEFDERRPHLAGDVR